MYSFLITHASKILYGSLIAIALYACWNTYDTYQDMKQKVAEQSETIINQKNQLSVLATVADENAKLYYKAKQDEAELLNKLQSLNMKITSIKEQHKQELSTIEKEIDNAPEQIKQCLRSDIPNSIVSSLRQPTEASN